MSTGEERLRWAEARLRQNIERTIRAAWDLNHAVEALKAAQVRHCDVLTLQELLDKERGDLERDVDGARRVAVMEEIQDKGSAERAAREKS